MAEEKEEKSNTKNSNPKIGRPAKTDQEQQFKNHYLQNRKKFQLECQLLVYIHHIFFDEIPTHPNNQRVPVADMLRLFEIYDCLSLYQTLAKLNEHYFKSSCVFPQQKLRYTSLIDVSYMMRQIKIEHGSKVNSYQLILLIFFFLFNQKVVNAPFYDYFSKRVELFRNGMINGPDHCELNKMDTLIIALALEVAIREGLLIEEEVEEDFQPPINATPPHHNEMGFTRSLHQLQQCQERQLRRKSSQVKEEHVNQYQLQSPAEGESAS